MSRLGIPNISQKTSGIKTWKCLGIRHFRVVVLVVVVRVFRYSMTIVPLRTTKTFLRTMPLRVSAAAGGWKCMTVAGFTHGDAVVARTDKPVMVVCLAS